VKTQTRCRPCPVLNAVPGPHPPQPLRCARPRSGAAGADLVADAMASRGR
jgi:hypothetical protein